MASLLTSFYKIGNLIYFIVLITVVSTGLLDEA